MGAEDEGVDSTFCTRYMPHFARTLRLQREQNRLYNENK